MKTTRQKAFEDLVKIVSNARPSELTKQVQINLSKYGHQHEWVEFEIKPVVGQDKPEYCWCAIRRGSMGQWIFPTKGNYVTYFKTIKGCINNYLNEYLYSVDTLSYVRMDEGVKAKYEARPSITTNELSVLLQKEINKRNWKRVHDHNTFHKIIQDITHTVLVRSKCDYNLHYGTWYVTIDHSKDGINFEDTKVIKFDRDFQKYKHVRWGDRGNFSNVRTLVHNDFQNVEVSRIVSHAQKLTVERNIKSAEEWVVECEEKLQRAKAHVKECIAKREC